MATVTAGVAAQSGLWTTYILRKFVPMLQARKVVADYCMPAMIPKGAGGYIARWNIPQSFASTTIAGTLTEGSGTDGERAVSTISNVEATIGQAGEWMRISDVAADSFISGTLDVYNEQFVDAGAQQIDCRCREQGLASTTFLHAGDTTSGGATLGGSDTATAQDFVAIAGIFRGNDAKGFESLGGDFVWIIHPDQEVDIATHVSTSALSWSDVKKHTDGPNAFQNLIDNHRFVGRLGGTTAVRTTNINTITEDVAAYHSLALAMWGVGWLGLAEKGPKAPKIIMKRPDSGDTSQPLDMYMMIGWKIRAVARLLDSNRAMAVYTAV